MPIRINFLAEQHAAEDLKRRDPVKRVVWIAGGLVGVLVLWSAYLQARVMSASMEANTVEAQFKQIQAQYSLIRTNHAVASEAQHKLASLEQLATNRFLWATPLHALQYAMVDHVEITGIRGRQTYTIAEATPSVTNSTGVVRGKPASSRQRVAMTIDARDYSMNPVENIQRFQESLTNQPYFMTNLSKAEMTGRSPTQTEPGAPSRPFVTFTIECQYPEQVR
jgi:hypothetical protein